MLLGRVIGTVVSCVVYEGLESVPMLLVQPLTKHQQPEGRPIVCADCTRMAGPGELIYYEGGREAALALDPWFVPVDHAIVGIVDRVHLPPVPELGEEGQGP
ncbi:MAG: ethanolamine utilization protein EutN [Deltaproteobacteria bacterium]|nr:ethanolamine utilization protein EutN [Deltaproteobacteria bacterium]